MRTIRLANTALLSCRYSSLSCPNPYAKEKAAKRSGRLLFFEFSGQLLSQCGKKEAHSILLPFVSAHIAAASVLFVGTRLAALIGLQQMTVAIGAAVGIPRINRRATSE
jgi:hypothetical protein